MKPASGLICLTLLVLVLAQPEPVPTDNCIVVNDAGYCSQCVEGFYLEYFLCLPCAPLCRCSSQYNYCESCMSITYKQTTYKQLAIPQTQNNRCVLCYTKIASCLECTNSTTCTKCFGGTYVINTTNGSVCSQSLCQPNCEICQDSTDCQFCQEGYFLDPKDKKCSSSQCELNCLECSDAATCSKCMPGYRLRQDDGRCTNCTAECLECNQTACLVCTPGNYPDGNSCVASGYSNCILYEGGAAQASACQVCEPGYFVLFGSCNQCVGCDLCALQFLCQTPCFANATPFNYACLQPFVIYEQWIVLGSVLSILLWLMF